MRRFLVLTAVFTMLVGPSLGGHQKPADSGAKTQAPDAARTFAPDVPEPGSVETIARLTTDPRFVSPWVDDVLEGRPAILDIPAGRGRLIAFNFNPLHRDLNRSDYRLLWNAIINWTAILGVPDAPKK